MFTVCRLGDSASAWRLIHMPVALPVGLMTQRIATGIPCVTAAELPAKVQEVLAALEYANGPVTSAWGAKRAAAGHPAPFGITHIGLGNEACGQPNAVVFEPAEIRLDWKRLKKLRCG